VGEEEVQRTIQYYKEQYKYNKQAGSTCDSTSITCGASMIVSNCTPSSDAKDPIGERVL
jgi:hypothetical protein